jgi:radical SAM superfamily enzyme YgiQ (UPF0313 family)
MKIFLIIPPSIHYIEPYAYIEADRSNVTRPPLGLLYVATAARQSTSAEIRIVDLNIGDTSLTDLERIIGEERPDIVGFGVLSFNLLNCMEVCKVIRRVSPATVICFGGWHPTLYPEETLQLGVADCIVIGEGEQTFCEMIQALGKGDGAGLEALAGIRGVGYRRLDGSIQINERRDPLRNLDELPFPDYDLIDAGKYSHLLATTDNVVSIMTSRGCPQQCVFCDLRKTTYRFRSPSNIMEEIRGCYERGAREFFIQDDNFTIHRKRALEFCHLLAESGLRIKYKISSRVDYLDEELVKALKRSGCYRLYLGVESGSQSMLDYLEKGITVEQTRKAFRIAQANGIDCCAYVMIGIPHEGLRDIEATRRLVREIRPRHLQCSICTPMPRTRLYDQLLQEGMIAEDYWLAFAKKPDPSFRIRFASAAFKAEELRRIQNRIQREFYWSPRLLWRELRDTRGVRGLLAKARLAMRMLLT